MRSAARRLPSRPVETSVAEALASLRVEDVDLLGCRAKVHALAALGHSSDVRTSDELRLLAAELSGMPCACAAAARLTSAT